MPLFTSGPKEKPSEQGQNQKQKKPRSILCTCTMLGPGFQPGTMVLDEPSPIPAPLQSSKWDFKRKI